MGRILFTEKHIIDKGWSGDKKYCAVDEFGRKYLLRISPFEKKEARARCFEMMQKAAELGIEMCQPLEFGECEEGVYCIHSWIDGSDAEIIIPTLSTEQQYSYGIDAGIIARKLHSFPAPEKLPSWHERFGAKLDRKLKIYAQCELKHSGGDAFIKCIEENRHLITDRPQVWQHGDFHIGNMMIDSYGKLCIIDFDRDDYGDPWEEFNRIVWCAQISHAFAAGMLDGYFANKVPAKFWRLLALYISSNTIGSLPWAIPFGKEEIDVMLKQGAEILDWYDGMERSIPKWYEDWKER